MTWRKSAGRQREHLVDGGQHQRQRHESPVLAKKVNSSFMGVSSVARGPGAPRSSGTLRVQPGRGAADLKRHAGRRAFVDVLDQLLDAGRPSGPSVTRRYTAGGLPSGPVLGSSTCGLAHDGVTGVLRSRGGRGAASFRERRTREGSPAHQGDEWTRPQPSKCRPPAAGARLHGRPGRVTRRPTSPPTRCGPCSATSPGAPPRSPSRQQRDERARLDSCSTGPRRLCAAPVGGRRCGA